jgi:hypothetical protein
VSMEIAAPSMLMLGFVFVADPSVIHTVEPCHRMCTLACRTWPTGQRPAHVDAGGACIAKPLPAAALNIFGTCIRLLLLLWASLLLQLSRRGCSASTGCGGHPAMWTVMYIPMGQPVVDGCIWGLAGLFVIHIGTG